MRTLLLALALIASGCFGSTPRNPAVLPLSASQERAAEVVATFSVTLRPERQGGDDVTAISVVSELTDWISADDRAFTLSAPIVYAGVTGIADRVEDLTVRDQVGIVRLHSEDDPAVPGGFPFFRHWQATREVRAPISISYRSLVKSLGERSGGPPFEIRPVGGGVSGAGSGFLVLPTGDLVADIAVTWDLRELPESSIAASTFGDGDFKLRGPPSRLMQGWFMAGPVSRFPSEDDVGGFVATWLGDEPFDAEAEMAWASMRYQEFSEVFGYLDPPPPYRVFMRFLETPPFGVAGTALGNSFMLSRSATRREGDESTPRRTFAHEMIHQWVGGIDAPQGVSSWFSEGLTTHYTRLLLMRGAHESVEAYVEDVNEMFRRYFTSPARNLTADSITALGFMDESARRIPYFRGSFYFADLDGKLRAASGGRRDLDTMMTEVFDRRANGERFDHEAWIRTVVRELGPEAREHFESVILRGTTIIPLSEAFGRCFRRRPVKLATDEGEIDGFEWVRVAGVSDAVCRSGR